MTGKPEGSYLYRMGMQLLKNGEITGAIEAFTTSIALMGCHPRKDELSANNEAPVLISGKKNDFSEVVHVDYPEPYIPSDQELSPQEVAVMKQLYLRSMILPMLLM